MAIAVVHYCVCSAILIGAFLFAPTKFLLETDTVVVRRPVGDVRLAFSEISKVGTDDRWYGLSVKASCPVVRADYSAYMVASTINFWASFICTEPKRMVRL